MKWSVKCEQIGSEASVLKVRLISDKFAVHQSTLRAVR
jgi:hypothetical protein